MPSPLNQQSIQALVSLIADDDAEVREHVESQILELGEEVIPFLEQELDANTFNSEVQDRIVNLVHKLQYEVLISRLSTWALLGGEDLLQGLWLVATYQYPDLDLQYLRRTIDELYYQAWIRMRDGMNPLDQVRILNNLLLDDYKLEPNRRNFHSPGNSMINVVLESKRGNPISLCAIYLLVAQRLGLPIYGVNLPNVFVLTYKTEGVRFYINVFDRGLILKHQDITNYIQTLKLEPLEVFYEPCTHIDIIKRVLRNLVASFDHLGEQQKVQEVERLKALFEEE